MSHDTMADCVILIQARMTSSRFPGKVLAPLRGRPVIAHVVERTRMVARASGVILLTSREASDDPLAAYAEACLNLQVFRGELTDVVRRFQTCLASVPCTWFVRICGDSPVIDHELISLMLEQVTADTDLVTADTDLVTNVGERTFPAGQSVEVIRTSTFLRLDSAGLDADEQEHVTMHYYRRPWQYRIRNIKSSDPSLAQRRLVVDSLDDLKALDELLVNTPDLATGFARLADVLH
jgi:spore coat polysaccharide biosynthesis protein SpsF